MSDEPDTPEQDLALPELRDLAHLLVQTRTQREGLEAQEEKLREALLKHWDEVPQLHGILLSNGDAVRRTWSVRATVKIEPARLREVMADASDFIEEQVKMANLRKAYPDYWERLGKVKREQTITVRLKEKA